MNESVKEAATILLVEEDDDPRPLFKQLLTNKGYKVKPSISEADALEKVSNGIGRVDVILIDLVKTPTKEILRAGQRIRERKKTNVPVVAIAEEYKDELQGTSAQVGENEFVVYLEDAEELFDLLLRLTNTKPKNAEIKD